MSSTPSIIYTITDEAPALATYSLLPIISAYSKTAGVNVETRDISVAGRILVRLSCFFFLPMYFTFYSIIYQMYCLKRLYAACAMLSIRPTLLTFCLLSNACPMPSLNWAR